MSKSSYKFCVQDIPLYMGLLYLASIFGYIIWYIISAVIAALSSLVIKSFSTNYILAETYLKFYKEKDWLWYHLVPGIAAGFIILLIVNWKDIKGNKGSS